MPKVRIKSKKEIEIMKEGGGKLAKIKKILAENLKEGISAAEIDNLAEKLIKKESGKPSFKMVPGYSWTTCINVNEGVVHGIPKEEIIFKTGDLVSLDIGFFYQGFHTDTSISVLLGNVQAKRNFLELGRKTLGLAVRKARVGNKVGDISKVIEKTVTREGFSPIKALVGHGIGHDLHEGPAIPCFNSGSSDEKVLLVEGMVLAIEVMYCSGEPDVVVDGDGWTIRTRDGKIAGLFEETVAVTQDGPLVLTA